ncbi:ATP-binding protein [Metabacillus fastidiosus]|uniref:ATP-binding protein n=1 Tax=Metabacillus fastidiosus TaxID=1458 RepID=UPI002DB8B1F1|nr:ATP-binding protein [Metabacillus fastidiosus]MEC2074819.1 ATP-binding protein [Metabacillus fastidiosus]
MQRGINHPYKSMEDFIVNAIYTEQLLGEYQGNPFIESLPPILTEEQIIQYCSVFPKFDPKERKLDSSYRFHCVQRVFQYFQPFESHIDLEQKISRSIRQGYISRNPFDINQVKQRHESYKGIKEGRFLQEYETPIKRTATGFTMIGFSGIGKSSALERILSFYPQLIRHTSYQGKIFNNVQIPWLKLDCPFDGSIKGLCISFFSEIDRLLGTNYFSKYKLRGNTVDTLLQHMVHIANLYAIGVLIIDEIQHLNLSKSGGSDKMLNFFVTLVNTIGIPVILVGTNKAVSILQSQFRQARRGSGQGDVVWNQMPKDTTWDLFVEGLWDYQWVKNFTPLNEEINALLYEESQGIIDIAVKLFMITQLRAISTGAEKITVNLLKSVGKENLRLVRPMLNALKSGIPSEIAKYDDIRPIDMEEQIERYKSSIDVHEKIRIQRKLQESKRIAKQNSLREEIVLFLLSMETDSEIANRITNKILKEYGEEGSISEAKKAAMKLLIINEESKQLTEIKKEKNLKPSQKEGNILCILGADAKKKKQSVYEQLVKHGYVKTVSI